MMPLPLRYRVLLYQVGGLAVLADGFLVATGAPHALIGFVGLLAAVLLTLAIRLGRTPKPAAVREPCEYPHCSPPQCHFCDGNRPITRRPARLDTSLSLSATVTILERQHPR